MTVASSEQKLDWLAYSWENQTAARWVVQTDDLKVDCWVGGKDEMMVE